MGSVSARHSATQAIPSLDGVRSRLESEDVAALIWQGLYPKYSPRVNFRGVNSEELRTRSD